MEKSVDHCGLVSDQQCKVSAGDKLSEQEIS